MALGFKGERRARSSQLMLPLTQDGQGYAATFDLGLQMH
jgi:hypothetical protein